MPSSACPREAAAAFVPGDRVRLKGLQACPDLNDACGALLAFDTEKGRWQVRLEDGRGSKQVKEANLARVAAAETAPKEHGEALAQLRLAGVLSSNIGDQKRLARLTQCLRSVEEQTVRLAAFFIVWSAPDALVQPVQELLANFTNTLKPSPVHCLRQTKRTSQFYDIRWLYHERISKEPLGTWLIFTDDDDLWGPRRVEMYLAQINAHAHQPRVTGVCATHKVRPSHRGKVANTVKEVEKHLTSGDAKHCGGVHVEEEFFDHSCPSESLGKFLSLCNEETLLHPFCDLRFTRFLQEYKEGGKVMYFPTDNGIWMYYYSTAYRTPDDAEAYTQYEEQDQASTVCKHRDEDKAEAVNLCRAALAGGKPTPEDLAGMVDFVAALRQNIEGVLIRQFPEDPMDESSLKRIAVGQLQGQLHAAKLAEKLARESCTRFGIRLV